MSYVTVKQAAQHLGISEQRVRTLLRSGHLLGYRVGPREWKVACPYVRRAGTRGPKRRKLP